MHPDLAPHLHSPECNAAIKTLLACHENNRVGRFFGVCNDVNEEVNRCLRREREENRLKNKARGLAMRERVFEKQKEAQ